jgi:triacylglycerol lipase
LSPTAPPLAQPILDAASDALPPAFSLRMRTAGLRLPLWRETGAGLELAGLLRDPRFAGRGVPRGDGLPVLTIPGFMAGDSSLTMMRGWLGRVGFRPHRAQIRLNADCPEQAVTRLEVRLEQLCEEHGGRIAVVGHSRGGQFARVLASRRPDLVCGSITLGSPLRDPLSVHPLVYTTALTVGLLGSAGVPRLTRPSCMSGACCERYRADLQGPVAADVRLVNLYSRADGIVDWKACIDEAGDAVEVDASHVGMAAHMDTYLQVATALRAFEEEV